MGTFPERKIRCHESLGQLSISPLSFQHITGIRAIAVLSFPLLWSEKEFGYFLAHESGHCFGLFSQAGLEAYFLSLLAQGDLDIVSIATHPRSRRKGLAKEILLYCEKIPGVMRLFLEVESENGAAIGLYQKAGYKKYGLRKGYYQGKKDAILMTKSL